MTRVVEMLSRKYTGEGGEERRRYKAMTIMAVESAADVRHGGGGGERESYHPASVFTRHF